MSHFVNGKVSLKNFAVISESDQQFKDSFESIEHVVCVLNNVEDSIQIGVVDTSNMNLVVVRSRTESEWTALSTSDYKFFTTYALSDILQNEGFV